MISMKTLLLIVTISVVVSSVAAAADGAVNPAATAGTSVYAFDAYESTVTQTGGFAGFHRVYAVKGQIHLAVDPNAGTASFGQVDANAVDDGPFHHDLDLDEVFNLSALPGTILDDGSVRFEGNVYDGSSVVITLVWVEGTLHLRGVTVPPPQSADFFVYELDATARLKYAGGTGEPNDPYRIATAEQMNAIGAEPNDWDRHFQLTADLDLSAYAGTSFKIIGHSAGTPFNGTFDGGGHVLRNLTITYDAGDGVGLFGALGPAGRIRNLKLVDACVQADTYVGALVGYNAGGTIQNCQVTAEVQGTAYTGGIAGISIDNGLICDCRADVNVAGQWYETGGIAGASSHSTIARCTAAGTVAGSDNTGGVAGRQDWGAMSDCSSTCAVTGVRWTGGLLGRNTYSDVSGSFATGAVSGADAVGGLVGFSDSEVRDCWAAAPLRGDSAVGGLIGEHVYGFVFHSYSRSVVQGPVAQGGFVGRQWGTCLYVGCFWDRQVDVLPAAVADVAGVSPKSSAELKMESTFTQAGWDFVGETANGTSDTWRIQEGQDYPSLAWQSLPGATPATQAVEEPVPSN
jgi:hypothetical protein